MKARIRWDATYRDKEVVLFETERPDAIAFTAMAYIERWGLVAGIPDGEDTAGRARLRLPTPEELVSRAFAIATRTYEVARERGHMVALPDLNEINVNSDALKAKALAKVDAEA